MKMLIGADIVPTYSNYDSFIIGNIDGAVDVELLEMLGNADFNIFNLETPLADVEMPIKKCGPNLIAPTKTINGIKNLGVNLFILANNHIMDQDVNGLNSTIEILDKNSILHIGAGSNLTEARKPYIYEKDAKKVDIYVCAEHEFSIATDDMAGANPYDAIDSPKHIKALKEQCDYVIVLYHGGKEHYRYPSPDLQKNCRAMIDVGSDLVVCQHSHCIGCKEDYNNGTIVYGQGNFIFDSHSNEFWDSSLLIELDIEEDVKINYIPLEKKNGKVFIPVNRDILDGFYKRSAEIKKTGFIEEKYNEFSDAMLNGYLQGIYGVSLIYRIINKLCGHRLKKKIPEKQRYALINFIECEAHRELLLKGLKRK